MSAAIQPLINFISQYVVLTDTDLELISSEFSEKTYKKGNFIVKETQTCRHLQFVIYGIYRVYQVNDGKEITSYFSYTDRNPFVASFVSLLTEQPSKETVECIDDGILLSIPYTTWQSFYAKSEAINTFGRKMAELNYVLAMERIASLQYKSATDRYALFMKIYPNLLNLIPHHYIASYLGITPESLSRVRKNSINR